MYQIETFEDAVEYIEGMIGKDFEKTMDLVSAILENPSNYTGPQAAVAAIKVSGYRTRLGLQAQHWKLKSAKTKKSQDRLVKDALMVLYDALTEVINTLKLTARHEHELVK